MGVISSTCKIVRTHLAHCKYLTNVIINIVIVFFVIFYWQVILAPFQFY